MSASELDAVVIGAGVAGLAAATELRRQGLAVRVLDAGSAAGGVVRSERTRGYLLERGPNTLLVRAPMAAFVREHGLEGRLLAARPASRLRFLVREGRLVPVPLGPLAFARTPLLSARGKLRLLAEPFVRRGDATGETVAAFGARRLGEETVSRLLGPVLTGIYAGDERRLGAEAVFPTLVAAERDHGSIVRGLLASALRRGTPRGLRGTWSANAGIAGLVAPLVDGLGDSLTLASRVGTLAADGAAFRLELHGAGGGETLSARRVVVATPASEAAALLRGLDAEAAKALEAIDYAPVASVSLGVDPGQVREPIEGFGFLVPREEGRELLGCLFPSRLFPDRAPAGRELLTVLLGGARSPETVECSDEELLRVCERTLDPILGLRAGPEPLAVTRWPRAVAQPGPEHPRLVADVRARLSRWNGLELAGGYLEGVAVGDALASGVAAARRLAARGTPPA